MPFEIERIHFEKRGEHDTGGKILHIVTLTVGNQVTLRSRKKPQFKTTLYKWQSALVPACMGEYELINDAEGLCTVVIHRWKKG